MGLHHHMLARLYHPATAVNAIRQSLGWASPDRLRILLHHDIAPHDRANFAAQLRWLARRWSFVSPVEFAAMVAGDRPVRGRNLLLTFDDGFASNRTVAEEVLNPMGIRALFFVVSDLVSLTDRRDVLLFLARNISLQRDADCVPAYWDRMTWPDLAALCEQGHEIGAHTGSHARLSAITDDAVLAQEIVASADVIAGRLGTSVDHFSYTFGNLESFSARAMAVARTRFRFVHSGLRGDNVGVPALALRRDSLASQNQALEYQSFANPLAAAFLEGVADRQYAGARARLDAWVSETC